jgi:hypothetical protein
VGFVLVILTLWLESAGIGMLIAWIRQAAEGDIQQMALFAHLHWS